MLGTKHFGDPIELNHIPEFCLSSPSVNHTVNDQNTSWSEMSISFHLYEHISPLEPTSWGQLKAFSLPTTKLATSSPGSFSLPWLWRLGKRALETRLQSSQYLILRSQAWDQSFNRMAKWDEIREDIGRSRLCQSWDLFLHMAWWWLQENFVKGKEPRCILGALNA